MHVLKKKRRVRKIIQSDILIFFTHTFARHHDDNFQFYIFPLKQQKKNRFFINFSVFLMAMKNKQIKSVFIIAGNKWQSLMMMQCHKSMHYNEKWMIKRNLQYILLPQRYVIKNLWVQIDANVLKWNAII